MKGNSKQIIHSRRVFFPLWTIGLILTLIFISACADPAPAPNIPPPTVTPSPAPDIPYDPLFIPTGCPFDIPPGYSIECGYLAVPEVRRPAPAGSVEIAVAIVKSRSDSPQPDPVIFLDGGPGGYTLEYIRFLASQFSPLLVNRDIVFFDQRGIGFSRPSLNCPEVDDYVINSLTTTIDSGSYLKGKTNTYLSCLDRLRNADIDLRGYTTRASADDVNDLRQALGYDQVNLLGISYGTLLAQAIVDQYEAEGWIRAIVLDSPVNPQNDLFGEFAPNFQRSLALLAERCDAHEKCAARFEDLEAAIYEMANMLEEDPVTVTIRNPDSGERVEVLFDGDRFLLTIFYMLYGREETAWIPDLVFKLRIGQITALSRWGEPLLLDNTYLSEGLFASVICADEGFFVDPAKIEAANESIPPVLAEISRTEVSQLLPICDTLSMERAASIDNEPILSGVPTLVLSGKSDPITPPAWGQQVAGSFRNSTYHEFMATGHAVLASEFNADECSLQMTLLFLNTPTDPPDDACVANLGTPGLIVP